MAQADPDGRAAVLVKAASGWMHPTAPVMETGLGGPFDLIDSSGHPVTDRSFRGKWMLVYFGYTYCPDVCPTTLQTISNVLDQRFTGLTGSAAQVAAAEATYRVYSHRVNAPGSKSYVVDHSSYIYLDGPDGKLKALFQDGMTEPDMVIAITAAMSQRG